MHATQAKKIWTVSQDLWNFELISHFLHHRDGNQGEPSNVRQAYVPSPENMMDYNDIEGGFANGPEHRVISGPTSNKPGRVLLYIVVGIVAFIVLCVVLVLIIVISYRSVQWSMIFEQACRS